MRKFISLTLIFIGFWTTTTAQQVRSVMPYEVVGGKMLVDMKINGKMQKLIFDTGGRTTITQELLGELALTTTDSTVVTDVNSIKSTYYTAKLESISTPDGINFKGFTALIAPAPSPFECFGATGLIGSEILGQTILEIDPQQKTITITSAESAAKASLRVAQNFVKQGVPIINIAVGTNNHITTLFDTGYGGFLSLKESDYDMLSDAGVIKTISEAMSEGAIGMAGKADTRVSYRVEINSIRVGAAKFTNNIITTATPPYSLLGMKLLDYGKVTIDYPRGVFYFEAYQNENDRLSTPKDFDLKVENGDLLVSTVWTVMKDILATGDKVTHINNKATGKYDFCESITKGIPELNKKKKNKLKIATQTGVKEIMYINK